MLDRISLLSLFPELPFPEKLFTFANIKQKHLLSGKTGNGLLFIHLFALGFSTEQSFFVLLPIDRFIGGCLIFRSWFL